MSNPAPNLAFRSPLHKVAKNGTLNPRQAITYNVTEHRIPSAADGPDSGEIRAALADHVSTETRQPEQEL